MQSAIVDEMELDERKYNIYVGILYESGRFSRYGAADAFLKYSKNASKWKASKIVLRINKNVFIWMDI